MWQVFYDSGKTIRESSEQDWADIPKTGITAVQMIWQPYNWTPYLRDEFNFYRRIFPGQWQQIVASLEINLQDYETLKRAFFLSVGRTTGQYRGIIHHIGKSIDEKFVEAETVMHDTKNQMIKDRAKKELNFLNNFRVKSKRLAIMIGAYQHQIDKTVTLQVQDKVVAFYQHKHHIKTATRLMGELVDEQIAQEIGMIVNRKGDCISIVMDLKNGTFTSQFTNVVEMGLSLKLHGITLEDLPE